MKGQKKNIVESPQTPVPSVKRPLKLLPSPSHLLMGGVLIFALSISGYFFFKYQKTQSLLKNPSQAAQIETKTIVEQVGKLIQLPSNENPTIATVSDKSKLKDQPFFANAENGDKVLIYAQGKKAILYRPSIDKIIEVAPINLGSQTTNAEAAAKGQVAGVETQVKPTSEPVRVVIYNGSGTSGKAKNMEDGVKAKFGGLVVTATGNANKKDYDQNIVVDLKGNHQTEASQIAKEINGQLLPLPEGETKPDADILIIVAK